MTTTNQRDEATTSKTDYAFRQYSEAPPTTRHYLWQPVLRRLARLPSGSKVLEAGCGNGSFAKVLSEQGYDVCGVDLSESGIAQARRSAPNVRFEASSVYEDLHDLFGCKFDAVVSLEVIEHLYDPETFVQKALGCLSPGGSLILSTPYHGWLKNVVIAVSGKHDKHFNPLCHGGHIKFWSRNTLTRLLEKNNAKNVEFEGAGRFPLCWKSMLLYCTV